MSNLPSDPRKFSRLRLIQQITENHCGPAVLEMLLGNIGVNVSQPEITEAAGATHTIETHGTRVDQLAKAVHQLVPIARLWFKEKASLDDIIYVLEEAKYPVGVEWQGLFEDMDDDDDDYGHYSIIVHIDRARGELIVVDPYKDYIDQNRIIRIDTFMERWRVHGIATAARCQLVAACDLAVAALDARFAVSGINVGLFCSTPAVPLSRNVQRKQAMHMLLTGDFIDAGTAQQFGLVNTVVAAEQLAAATRELAEKIATKAPLSVRLGKKMFYEQLPMGLADAYAFAAERMACNMDSDDAREGIDAFIQKRKPVFTGK